VARHGRRRSGGLSVLSRDPCAPAQHGCTKDWLRRLVCDCVERGRRRRSGRMDNRECADRKPWHWRLVAGAVVRRACDCRADRGRRGNGPFDLSAGVCTDHRSDVGSRAPIAGTGAGNLADGADRAGSAVGAGAIVQSALPRFPLRAIDGRGCAIPAVEFPCSVGRRSASGLESGVAGRAWFPDRMGARGETGCPADSARRAHTGRAGRRVLPAHPLSARYRSHDRGAERIARRVQRARHSAAAGRSRRRSTFANAAGPGHSSWSQAGSVSPARLSGRRSSSSPRPFGNSASAFGIS